VANDTCIIRFLPGVRKAMRRIAKRNSDRLHFIDHAIRTVAHNGWILSVHSGLIKVLDQPRHVGEVRDLGSGGYRLFFFWEDGQEARTLLFTAIEKKSKLKGRARVNEFIAAAAALRRRHLKNLEESAE
jgi:mRNA-degrading endonuclease RelE of RelBE toxin-antitoxin system